MSARVSVNKASRPLVLGGLLAAMCLALLGFGERADAHPIYMFEVKTSTNQAGAHPDLVLDLAAGTPITEGNIPCRCNKLRDIIFQTPAGFVGSPSDIPRCSAEELANAGCPVDTQVGVVVTRISTAFSEVWWTPLYNMIPAAGQLASLASPLPFFGRSAVGVIVSARTEGDYGLEFATRGIPGAFATPYRITTITWGVPADPIHDALRFPFVDLVEFGGKSRGRCDQGDGDPVTDLINNEYPYDECAALGPPPFPPTPSNTAAVPFLSNPTACTGPLTATVDIVAYDLTTGHAEDGFPAITGCDQLAFDPSLSAKPTTTEADAPSGIDVDLRVPQTLSATNPSPSQIRHLTVSLPDGFTVNPNAADGKTSCSAEQARFGTREAAQCPEFSKIGTVEIESSSLPGALPGAVYLGEPLPGERYRVFLTAEGFSLNVKLAGVARPDPLTGRLDVSFFDLPQAPFQRFNLHIFGAERGLLATPTQCGTYAVHSTFVPWAAGVPNQTSTQFFVIDSGPAGTPCPPARRPFNPELSAGVTDSTGGFHTDFVFDLTGRDGEQRLTGVNVSTPPGFSAVLAGIPYCPDATLAALAQSSYLGVTELTSAACPQSQVGVSITTAGAGSRPLSQPGKVYLAGPYKGAPMSLAVVTPAVSGPYDLGNVVVRVAVYVDPATAQVRAVSDPLPQIIEGIPLRLRRVLVMLERDDFALNPTNCDPFSVDATAFGDQGASAALSSHFQVANCGSLPFAPRLELKLTGGVKRRGHPAIKAIFSTKPGEANARRVTVTLPRGELLDNSHIGSVCTRVDFAKDTCPAASVYGTAEAITPLLDAPLKGKVYLRSSSHMLPDLAVDLEGQIDIELAGRVDSVGGALRTSFEAIPDAPVSRFVLNLKGGSKGLLQNSESLCGANKRATTTMTGQNSVRLRTQVRLQVDCGAKARKARAKGLKKRAAISNGRGH